MMKNAVFDGIGENNDLLKIKTKKETNWNVQPVSCKDMRMTSY